MADHRNHRGISSKRLSALLVLVLAFVCVLPGIMVRADEVVPAAKGVYVYDDAGLLTGTEESSLSQYLEARGQEAGCGIYVVTTSDPGTRTGDRYLEDFYNRGFDTGQIDTDAVLLYVDMKERYVNVQAYGKAQDKIPDTTCDAIIDAIFDDLHYGDYYDAFRGFADKADYYMKSVPIYLRVWVQLLAALVIGGICVGIMAANSGGTMTVNANTYLDQRYSGIRARRDDYIRTSVKRRKKPQQSSSSGGGGSHRSSGGHSHSSAGRKF